MSDLTEQEHAEAVTRAALFDAIVEVEAEHIDAIDPRTLDIIGLAAYLLRNPEADVPAYPHE